MIYLFRKPTPTSRELERDPNNRVLYIDNTEEKIVKNNNKAKKSEVHVNENKNSLLDNGQKQDFMDLGDYISDAKIVDIEISSID